MLTAIVFTLGFFALLGLAFQRHPIFGLYAYMASFYVHPPSRWWGKQLPDLRWALLAAGVTFLAILVHQGKLKVRPLWIATVPALVLIFYCLWLWMQSLWALDSHAHFEATIQFTKYAIAFYLFWKIADSPERITDILIAHVIGCFFLGWLAFGEGLKGGARLDGVGGPGIDDSNTLSMFLGTGVAVAATLLLQVRGWRWWMCLAAVPFMLNGMVLAASRGAFLGLMGAGAVLFFLRPPERKGMFWVFAVLGLLLVASVVDQRFIARMLTVRDAVQQSESIDHSAEGRWVLIRAQLLMAKNRPLGVGHKGTAALSASYLDESYLTRRSAADEAARSSHNTFMTTLVEQGIFGAVMYVVLSLWGARTLLRLKRVDRHKTALVERLPATACCAAIAVVWLSGQFTDYLMAEVQIWMFALLAASLYILSVATKPSARTVAPGISQPVKNY